MRTRRSTTPLPLRRHPRLKRRWLRPHRRGGGVVASAKFSSPRRRTYLLGWPRRLGRMLSAKATTTGSTDVRIAARTLPRAGGGAARRARCCATRAEFTKRLITKPDQLASWLRGTQGYLAQVRVLPQAPRPRRWRRTSNLIRCGRCCSRRQLQQSVRIWRRWDVRRACPQAWLPRHLPLLTRSFVHLNSWQHYTTQRHPRRRRTYHPPRRKSLRRRRRRSLRRRRRRCRRSRTCHPLRRRPRQFHHHHHLLLARWSSEFNKRKRETMESNEAFLAKPDEPLTGTHVGTHGALPRRTLCSHRSFFVHTIKHMCHIA